MTVTARGQVAFRKDVPQHLGIRPGDKIELDLLPDGRGMLKAARQTGTIAGFVGLLADRTKKIVTGSFPISHTYASKFIICGFFLRKYEHAPADHYLREL